MPRDLTGPASSCLNMLIFMGAFVVQAVFGLIVGLWSPDGAGRYPVIAYQAAFGCMVLLQLPGLVVYVRQRLMQARPKAMVSEEVQSAA